MKVIRSERQYQKALKRIEELLKVVDNNTDPEKSSFIELDELSELVANYEEEQYPVRQPSLNEVIRLRMFEMGLKQKDLAKILDTPAARISEYLNGKREITLNVAKALNKQLNIDADIILGS